MGLGGCDKLCELGVDAGCTVPCQVQPLPEPWTEEPLASLIPWSDAAACEASVSEDGALADALLWVPGTVHDANMAGVGAAQDHGWSRLQDNWYGTSGDYESAKWSELANERGETLRIDVRKESGGAQVKLSFVGLPALPPLSGDVTLFELKNVIVAISATVMKPLVGLPRGSIIATTDDGFYFRSGGPSKIYRYGADAEVKELFAPVEGAGQFRVHGLGPQGALWVTFDPNGDHRPIQIGHLANGEWTMEDVPAVDPPLTGSIALSLTPDGSVYVLGGKGVHRRSNGTWQSAALPHKAALHGLHARADGSAVVLTEKAVLVVRPEQEQLAVTSIAKLSLGELHAAGETVVVRGGRKALLVRGDTTEKLPGFSSDVFSDDGFAVGSDGTIAMAVPKKGRITVRAPDGTVSRYPENGKMPESVGGRVWIDPTGRVWVTGDSLHVVENKELRTLPNGSNPNQRASRLSFMGNGTGPAVFVKK